jgi:hypothetical protein
VKHKPESLFFGGRVAHLKFLKNLGYDINFTRSGKVFDPLASDNKSILFANTRKAADVVINKLNSIWISKADRLLVAYKVSRTKGSQGLISIGLKDSEIYFGIKKPITDDQYSDLSISVDELALLLKLLNI